MVVWIGGLVVKEWFPVNPLQKSGVQNGSNPKPPTKTTNSAVPQDHSKHTGNTINSSVTTVASSEPRDPSEMVWQSMSPESYSPQAASGRCGKASMHMTQVKKNIICACRTRLAQRHDMACCLFFRRGDWALCIDPKQPVAMAERLCSSWSRICKPPPGQ